MCNGACLRRKSLWSHTGREEHLTWAQGGLTMRDSATAGLRDQPPAPPRTLEQIPLQELYRPVPEEVLPPVTPPPVPAEQPIEVDDEDTQPPYQPQQSMQPPLTPPRGGLHVALCQIHQCKIQNLAHRDHQVIHHRPRRHLQEYQSKHPGSTMIHWYVAPGTPPWMPQDFNDSRSATSTLATAISADHCTAVDAAFMVATCLSRTTSSGRGNTTLRANFHLQGE